MTPSGLPGIVGPRRDAATSEMPGCVPDWVPAGFRVRPLAQGQTWSLVIVDPLEKRGIARLVFVLLARTLRRRGHYCDDQLLYVCELETERAEKRTRKIFTLHSLSYGRIVAQLRPAEFVSAMEIASASKGYRR